MALGLAGSYRRSGFLESRLPSHLALKTNEFCAASPVSGRRFHPGAQGRMADTASLAYLAGIEPATF
jgi:hypothetical protein